MEKVTKCTFRRTDQRVVAKQGQILELTRLSWDAPIFPEFSLQRSLSPSIPIEIVQSNPQNYTYPFIVFPILPKAQDAARSDDADHRQFRVHAQRRLSTHTVRSSVRCSECGVPDEDRLKSREHGWGDDDGGQGVSTVAPP